MLRLQETWTAKNGMGGKGEIVTALPSKPGCLLPGSKPNLTQ